MKNICDKAVIVERMVTADSVEFTVCDVTRNGETLRPGMAPFKHRNAARAWAADWNRKNFWSTGQLKTLQRERARIGCMARMAQCPRVLHRRYGDDFARTFGEACRFLRECENMAAVVEVSESEPCQPTA